MKLQSLRTAPTLPQMADLLDVAGRRWSLRVVWELRGGPLNFRALRHAAGELSPGVLQCRLHEWRDLGVVENIPGLGYRLTARGEQLFQLLAPLQAWSGGGTEFERSQHK